jgi:hypothetical protein
MFVPPIQALVPVVIRTLQYLEVKRLLDGYDTGRGFVFGEEEMRGRIDHMSDRREIVEELRFNCDTNKMDVLKCLGQQHSKIAHARTHTCTH